VKLPGPSLVSGSSFSKPSLHLFCLNRAPLSLVMRVRPPTSFSHAPRRYELQTSQRDFYHFAPTAPRVAPETPQYPHPPKAAVNFWTAFLSVQRSVYRVSLFPFSPLVAASRVWQSFFRSRTTWDFFSFLTISDVLHSPPLTAFFFFLRNFLKQRSLAPLEVD